MTNPTKRRPLPALVFLVALTLLTALVWWRVLNRDSGASSATSDCTPPAVTTKVLPAPATVTVTVLNSTDRTGLAATVAGGLTKRGFAVAGYGNDSARTSVAGVAEIRFPADRRDAATLLGYYFPGATLVPVTTATDGKVVVALGRKYTRLPTASAITAALTKDNAAIGSATRTTPAGPSPSC